MITVLQHGRGYDFVFVSTADDEQLVLGIRCQTCRSISYNATDVEQRYCGVCHRFHDDDAKALDQIAALLNTCAWDIEALSAIAAAVRGTGRVVDEVHVERELAQLKAVLDAFQTESKIKPE